MKRFACLILLAGVAGCDVDLSGLGCGDARTFSDEISATALDALLEGARAAAQ